MSDASFGRDVSAERIGPWLAAALVLAGALAWSAAITFDLVGPVETRTRPSDLAWAGSFFGPIAIGGFLAARRPRTAVGWLLAAGPTLVGLGVACEEYATAALAASPAWPGALPVLLVGQVVFGPGLLLLLGAFVVFPAPR